MVTVLPVGSEVLSVVPHGKTRVCYTRRVFSVDMIPLMDYQWSIGLRVDIEVDGDEKEYFLKASSSTFGSNCQTLLMAAF